jgi:uncharacterized protein involved in response to NO
MNGGPYRVLFPLGILFAIVGTALWPLHAMHLIPYPVVLHPVLMIQGFEHCFILGFLLTAMPSFLHARRATRGEVTVAAASMIVLLTASLFEAWIVAEAAYLATILLLIVMAARRFRAAEPPPEEFVFVLLGLLLGMAGAVISLLSTAGVIDEPSPRFGIHMISFGMVLSIVLGVGGLLVPTFTSMREPLVIPGLARPHERGPRRVLYAALGVFLIAALVIEAFGHAHEGAILRAATAAVVLLWVWKLFRMPGVRDILSWCLWIAGWMILVGLLAAAVDPKYALPGVHVLFIGGLGLLTAAIATRVTVRHGGHPALEESRVLRVAVPTAFLSALLVRIVADFLPERALPILAASATLWIAGWLLWGGGAFRYLARVRSAPVAPERAPSGREIPLRAR